MALAAELAAPPVPEAPATARRSTPVAGSRTTVSHDGRYVVGPCRDGEVFDPPLPDKSAYLVLFDRTRGTPHPPQPERRRLSDVSSVAVSDDGRSVLFGSLTSGYLGGTAPRSGPTSTYWRRGSGLTMVSVGDDVMYRRGRRAGSTSPATAGRCLFESDSALVPGDNARGATDTDVSRRADR